MIPTSFAGFSDPISSTTHLLAALASIVGACALLVKGRGNGPRVVSLFVYSVGLVFLFSMSGVFHLLERGTVARDVLQRLDHAGIWVLIAATFTPIHIILFREHWRWAILGGVWLVAITGLVLEVVFFNQFPESVLVSLFLGLGWVGAISAYGFRRRYGDPSLKFLVIGAIFYSAGAVIDFSNWPVLIPGVIGAHEVFHFFVIGGAVAHWLFVYRWCDHPVQNELLFDIRIHPHRVFAEAMRERIKVEGDSPAEIKTLIQKAVARRYHSSIRPRVRLRYHQEEWLDG